jgi:ubiquinone biosynthesis protein COQ4
MLQFINRLKMARTMGRLIEDPAQTHEIFELSRLGRASADQRPLQAMTEFVMRHSDLVALYESGYRPKLPSMSDLRAYGPGTLGAAYYAHLKSNNLQPDFFPDEGIPGILGYTILRLRQTHDIWHVLTGYGTSVREELALQAFTLAQVHNGLSISIVFGGMLHVALKNPVDIAQAMDLIVEGWSRGKAARFLPAVRWEEMFSEPLPTARAAAGIDLRPYVMVSGGP